MSEASIRLQDLRAFIFDLDGTLYRGNTAVAGAVEFVTRLNAAGVPLVYLTNNATTPPLGVAERLAGMGFPVTLEQILTSAQATAAWVAAEMPGARAYVVGEVGLWEALDVAGVARTADWRQADVVVAGMDREVTYAKLRDAALAIRRGARFIATNTDRTLPTEMGLIPGAGSLIGLLEIATDVKPRVIGKPSADIMRLGLQRLGMPAGLTAAVGDRTETDILGAQAAGMPAIAVLTGASTAEMFAAMQPPPDWVFEDMAALGRAYFGRA